MPAQAPVVSVEREAGRIVDAVRERGVASRGELEFALGARRWGPGRFGQALRSAVRDGRLRRVGASRYRLASPAAGVRDAPQRFAVPPPDRV